MDMGRILLAIPDQEAVSVIVVAQQIIHLVFRRLCIFRFRIPGRQCQCVHLECTVGTGYTPCHAQGIIAAGAEAALIVQLKTQFIGKGLFAGLLIHHRRIALPYLIPAIQMVVIILVVIAAVSRRLERRSLALSEDPQPALCQRQVILILCIRCIKGTVSPALASRISSRKIHQRPGILHTFFRIRRIRVLHHIGASCQRRCHLAAYDRIVGITVQPVGLPLIGLLLRRFPMTVIRIPICHDMTYCSHFALFIQPSGLHQVIRIPPHDLFQMIPASRFFISPRKQVFRHCQRGTGKSHRHIKLHMISGIVITAAYIHLAVTIRIDQGCEGRRKTICLRDQCLCIIGMAVSPPLDTKGIHIRTARVFIKEIQRCCQCFTIILFFCCRHLHGAETVHRRKQHRCAEQSSGHTFQDLLFSVHCLPPSF